MNLVLEQGRHYLGGEPVHCGMQLELQVRPWVRPGDAVFVPARYEADYVSEEKVRVTLHTTFGIVLPTSETVLRWPERRAA